MGMKYRFTTGLAADVAALARAEPDREVCGLLLGMTDGRVLLRPARNVATDPRRRFEIDPATLLAAHREEKRGGPAIIGCYHSHPGGAAEPSAQDAADAEPNGWFWLIAGRYEARLWRSVRNGAAHGRFDPAPLACIPESETSQSALSEKVPR